MSALDEAIALIRVGRKAEARPILESLINTEPGNIAAWLWYVETLPHPQEKIQALEACLQYNPNQRQVQQTLALLRGHLARRSPAELPTQQIPLEPPNGTPSAAPSDGSDSKKCPYCAETIKAEAIVCRFCGRDLSTGSLPNAAVSQNVELQAHSTKLLDEKIASLTEDGWQVINRTPTAAQLKKPKQWSQGCLWIFVILPFNRWLHFPSAIWCRHSRSDNDRGSLHVE